MALPSRYFHSAQNGIPFSPREDKAEQHLDGCQCRANGIGSEKQHVADRKGIDGEEGAIDAVDKHGGKVNGRR